MSNQLDQLENVDTMEGVERCVCEDDSSCHRKAGFFFLFINCRENLYTHQSNVIKTRIFHHESLPSGRYLATVEQSSHGYFQHSLFHIHSFLFFLCSSSWSSWEFGSYIVYFIRWKFFSQCLEFFDCIYGDRRNFSNLFLI